MPIHDWTGVSSGAYHDFHQDWAIEIKRALNRDVLPPGYEALTDQKILGFDPDVIAVEESVPPSGGVALTASLPRTRLSARAETDRAGYARRANRIFVKDSESRVVAMIELVPPGNKDRRGAIEAFVDKVAEFLQQRIHVLVIDLFPPTPRDPEGVHRLIWDEMGAGAFADRPGDKPLTVVGYDAGPPLTAWLDPVAVGDPLPDGSLFLAPGWHVNVPLEQTYQVSWAGTAPSTRRKLTSNP